MRIGFENLDRVLFLASVNLLLKHRSRHENKVGQLGNLKYLYTCGAKDFV